MKFIKKLITKVRNRLEYRWYKRELKACGGDFHKLYSKAIAEAIKEPILEEVEKESLRRQLCTFDREMEDSEFKRKFNSEYESFVEDEEEK